MEQIQVIVIAFVYLEYKQIHSANQINRAGNTLFIIRTGSCEIFFKGSEDKNQTQSSNTSPYRPYKGVSPTGLLTYQFPLLQNIPICLTSPDGRTCTGTFQNQQQNHYSTE